MTQETPTISRKEAATLLNISTRTLDRYVRQSKITPIRRGRSVTFNLDELRKFQQKRTSSLQPPLSIDADELLEEMRSREGVSTHEGTQHPARPEEKVYKHLYEEANRELKQKEELLRGANYRVGQLETKLQNMVPLLEFKKQKEEVDKLKGESEEREKVCTILKENIRIEKFNKKIFTILFFLSLSLFPILLIIHLLTT
jgi:excisionase family DNA binding protein